MHVYLSVNVFSTKVLIGDTIFTSPNGDGTAILRGHPSYAKVLPLAVQREYLHFSVILRPWVMVPPRESNLRPPALQLNALLTELILPRLNGYFHGWKWIFSRCAENKPQIANMILKWLRFITHTCSCHNIIFFLILPSGELVPFFLWQQ